MGLVLQRAILADIDPPAVETGELRVEAGRIVARGATVSVERDDEVVDCDGAVVLPGLVNGHTHLYSSLATGMPAPPRTPRNFLEILKFVWWRLDQALDAESIEMSASIGALEALRCGTTTLIDHHASPCCIAGALTQVERGIDRVGLRGVLCYETTDRHGSPDAGLAENQRYAESHAGRQGGRFGAMIGAHAAFTLSDQSLASIARLAEKTGTGVHIHVAEDPCDEDVCRHAHGSGVIERLEKHGIMTERSIFAHGTHLNDAGIGRVNAVRVWVAHNPRSNMNNAVGYAPTGRLRGPVMLGTDGIGGDMLSEARFAWFKSRDGHAGLGPDRILGMLAASARRASAALGVTLGQLRTGAAADLVVTDYRPATALNSGNLPEHVLFGIESRHVRHVVVDGVVRMKDRNVVGVDERAMRLQACDTAQRLWGRMGNLPMPE